jgi:serine/threonine protein kinase
MDESVRCSAESSSNVAHAAWDRKFPTKMIVLQRGDAEPLSPGRHLGKGGFGSVYEAKLDGIAVALKRIWIRGKPNARHQVEFEILQKMSVKRHKHVIEAIGFYVLPGRPNTELGLVIWPVAQYDLSRLLYHFEVLRRIHIRNLNGLSSSLVEFAEEEVDALEELSLLTQERWDQEAWSQIPNRSTLAELLLTKITTNLLRVFGCLARALEYLHNDQQIRHKDLKPSQVLVSSNGLWLTDFGWSVDITSLSNSATSNGDRTTARYHAPEREMMEHCGRSEDVFGLGCIYLEIALTLCQVKTEACLNPSRQEDWSFQSNLDQTWCWLDKVAGELAELRPLLHQMLARDPADRPAILEVVSVLSKCEMAGKIRRYFGPCCKTSNSI